MEQNNIQLSVVDVEQKYSYDITENVYGGGGIVSWGADNDVVKLLYNCYTKSATLKAAIDQSLNYILGEGVEISDDAASWKEKVNRRGTTMGALISHIASDLYIYGNFAIQVIFNKLGSPVELYPLDVARCRLNADKNKVYYSKKMWTKYQTKAEEYDRFGYADFDINKPTQIYFYNGNGIRCAYALSPWSAALDDVLCEIEGSRYSLNSITNGFAARYIINMPDTANLTDEQKKVIEDGIRKKFCGPDAPNNFMLYYSNDESKNISVQKIEADETPDRFIAMRKNSRENIFTSLRISPLLCGLTSDTNTGFATSEFSDSYKLFDKTVAEPVRIVLEDAVNRIIGVEDGVRILPFVLTFED